MVRKTLFAAASAVAITAVSATAAAQAAPILVELEGPIQDFRGYGPNTPRVLTVMDIPVIVDQTTNLHTPTTTRADSSNPGNNDRPYNLGQWYRGEKLQGRSDRGFIGGTAIVLGTFDPTYEFIQTDTETGEVETIISGGAIIADDVFSEPAENVVLGQVTSANCTNSGCNQILNDGEDYFADYLIGNNGVVMLPIQDSRLAAPDLLVDAFGFSLDLGADPNAIVGREFGAEGYYGDLNVRVDFDADDGVVDEVKALHYFLLTLTGADPALLANPDVAEIAVARAQCRDVDELEVRGGVHTALAEGTLGSDPADPVASIDKTIRILDAAGNQVFMGTPADVVPFGDAAGNPVANDPFGAFGLRPRNLPNCPAEITVEWVRINTTTLAVEEVLATTDLLPTG